MRIPPLHKFPKELHIGEETYQVKVTSRIPGANKHDIGLCDPSTHTIYIRKGITKAQAFRTLIHEVIHGIENEYSLRLSHRKVYQLEKAISDVLFANL